MHDVAAPRDRAECSGAVETTIDLTAAMATQGPWPIAVTWFTVRSDQLPGSSHRLQWMSADVTSLVDQRKPRIPFLAQLAELRWGFRCVLIAAEVSSG
jgi:hypothetical protein